MDKNNTARNRDRIYYEMDTCLRWSIHIALLGVIQ